MADVVHSTKQEMGFASREASDQDQDDLDFDEELDKRAIPLKYRGTAVDHKEMNTMGKKQVLMVRVLMKSIGANMG